MSRLQKALFEILDTPMLVADVVASLGKYNICVANNAYVRGYLEALCDMGAIHKTKLKGNRVLYSIDPVKEYTYKKCPYCDAQQPIVDKDVGTTKKCKKCGENMVVEISLSRGVVLSKSESVIIRDVSGIYP